MRGILYDMLHKHKAIYSTAVVFMMVDHKFPWDWAIGIQPNIGMQIMDHLGMAETLYEWNSADIYLASKSSIYLWAHHSAGTEAVHVHFIFTNKFPSTKSNEQSGHQPVFNVLRVV